MFSLTLTLAMKDWRLFWADHRAAALCFLVPIVLASAFGMIFDRPNRPDGGVQLAVLLVADGESEFARRIVADAMAHAHLKVEIVTRSELDSRLLDAHPGVAVVIPSNLDDLRVRPILEIRHHPLRSLEARWAEGAMTEIVMKRLAAEKLGRAIGALASSPPFETRMVVEAGPGAQFNSYSHSFSGMTLQYLLFWGMESGLFLLRERRTGTWSRLQAAPVPFAAVLFGKALATAAIALMQVLATFAFGYLAFGIRVGGSFPLIALAISALAAGIGLLVAAIGGSEARARSVSILAILGISMLGGLWLPSFLLPDWLREVSLALPTTWAMRALDGATWQGRSPLDIAPSLGMVLGFTALFLAVAYRQLAAGEARRRRGFRD